MIQLKRLFSVALFITTIFEPLVIAVLGITIYLIGLKVLSEKFFEKHEQFFNTAFGFGLFGSLLAWVYFLKNNWLLAGALGVVFIIIVVYYEIKSYFNNLKIRA